MGSGLAASLEAVVDKLDGITVTVAGVDYDVPAAIDPADLQAPCVWVDLDHLAPELMSGDGTAWVNCYAIAPNTDPTSTLEILDAVLGAVLDRIDLEDDIAPSNVILPSNAGEALPALRCQTLSPYYRTETP